MVCFGLWLWASVLIGILIGIIAHFVGVREDVPASALEETKNFVH